MKKYILLVLLLSGCNVNQTSPSQAIELCYNYFYGKNGYPASHPRALPWCETSAQNGSANSQTLLGQIYYQDEGVDVNVEKALNAFKQAAVQQHQHAQLMIFLINNVYHAETSSEAQKVDGLLMLEAAVNSGYENAIEVYNEVFSIP